MTTDTTDTTDATDDVLFEFDGVQITPSRLRRERQQRGMSRRSFAEAIQSTAKTLKRYENGEQTPRIETRYRIVSYLKQTDDTTA